ncbi:MAG: putative sulfate exporter family transporter, partial [Canibacter sp.]
GIIGGGALAVAVVVKLARVLMLAPIVATLSVQQRRKQRQAQDMHAEVGTELQGSGVTAKLPPIVPLFIIGFIAMVALRSAVDLPQAVLATGEILQTVLLSAAMFGLGCGVKVKKLVAVGAKPFLLAACATVLVVAIAFVGIIVAA